MGVKYHSLPPRHRSVLLRVSAAAIGGAEVAKAHREMAVVVVPCDERNGHGAEGVAAVEAPDVRPARPWGVGLVKWVIDADGSRLELALQR